MLYYYYCSAVTLAKVVLTDSEQQRVIAIAWYLACSRLSDGRDGEN